MNTENRRQHLRAWVKALRSGNYEQTDNTLRDYDGDQYHYCCLGVACEVFRLETGQGEWDDEYRFILDGQAHTTELPDTVAEWLGLGDTDPILNDDAVQATVANDRLEWSFDRIADAVEARYLS